MSAIGYVTIGAIDGKKSGAVCPPIDGKKAHAGIMIAYMDKS